MRGVCFGGDDKELVRWRLIMGAFEGLTRFLMRVLGQVPFTSITIHKTLLNCGICVTSDNTTNKRYIKNVSGNVELKTNI